MRLFPVYVIFCMAFTFTIVMSENQLPKVTDLDTYVNAVGGSIYYMFSKYSSYNVTEKMRPDATRWAVVVSFVNLNKSRTKIHNIPEYIRHKIPTILDFLDQLMVLSAHHAESLNLADKKFITLVGKESLWQNTLENFKDIDTIDIETNDQFNVIPFGDYAKRHNSVSKVDIKLYESCFKELAKNTKKERDEQCNIDLRCLKLISQQGSLSGRELTLWLYFFTYARFSCQCYLLTPSRDKELVHELCSTAYNEIIYLHKYNFEFMDSVLEKATLCTLLDYVQFMNRTWISTALQYLTQRGCYLKPKGPRRQSPGLLAEDQPKCSANVTTLTTATLALALRYNIKNSSSDPSVSNAYINSIERALHYLESNKYNIDFNVLFGAFLTQISFGHMKAECKASEFFISSWATQTHARLIKLVKRFYNQLPPRFNTMFPFFRNETPWLFGFKELRTRKTKLMRKNGWLHFDTYPFTGVAGSACTSYLSHMSIKLGKDAKCNAPQMCLKLMSAAVAPGSPYKYKLLYLLLAEYAKNCYFFSRIRDGEIKKELCTIARGQVQHLFQNKVDAMDFILEQVVLCAYHGYPDFLQSNWLSNMLQQQDSSGCFYDKQPKSASEPNVQKSQRAIFMGTTCDAQTTLFATSLLSLATRYIIDIYF